VSNDALRNAEKFLLAVLREKGGSLAPSQLLEAAATAPNRPPAEHLRLAIWSLLESDVVERGNDNSLKLRKPAFTAA
jgi:hypothetical protein